MQFTIFLIKEDWMLKQGLKTVVIVSAMFALFAAAMQSPASAAGANYIAFGDQLYTEMSAMQIAIADHGSLIPNAPYKVVGNILYCFMGGKWVSVGTERCIGVACGPNPYGPEHLYRIKMDRTIEASPAGNGTGVWKKVGTGDKMAVAKGPMYYILSGNSLNAFPGKSIIDVGANYASSVVYCIERNTLTIYSNKNGSFQPIGNQPKMFVKVVVDPAGHPVYLDVNGNIHSEQMYW
jgi:hypothetical protein